MPTRSSLDDGQCAGLIEGCDSAICCPRNRIAIKGVFREPQLLVSTVPAAPQARCNIVLTSGVSLEYLSRMRSALETDPFSGSTRLLLVFAMKESMTQFLEMRGQIDARSGDLSDRDMIVMAALADDDHTILLHSAGREVPRRSVPRAPELRSRYGVSRDSFALLLVGKDGGVKLARSEPMALDEIFALVDSMPMRRREMRERGR